MQKLTVQETWTNLVTGESWKSLSGQNWSRNKIKFSWIVNWFCGTRNGRIVNADTYCTLHLKSRVPAVKHTASERMNTYMYMHHHNITKQCNSEISLFSVRQKELIFCLSGTADEMLHHWLFLLPYQKGSKNFENRVTSPLQIYQ